MPPDAPDRTGPSTWLPAPSARVGSRVNGPADPVSPQRAVAGALVAVAGVVLGIWAVLTVTHEPDMSQGSTVSLPVLTSTPAPTTPTPAPPLAPPAASPTPRPTPTSVVVTPKPEPKPEPKPAPRPQPAAPVKPALTVLNNSRFSGLADRAAAQFRRDGWPVKEVGNYSASNLPVSTVYYSAGQRPAADVLAKAYGLRVLPRTRGLPGSGLVVVLTRAYRP